MPRPSVSVIIERIDGWMGRMWFALAFCLLVNLAVRLVLLPLSDITDADAIHKLFISIRWLDNPRWINADVWLPLTFYLDAGAIWLTGQRVLGPVGLTILLSVLTTIPVYLFCRWEFNARVAFFSALTCALLPVMIHHSLMPLADCPFAFFLACTLAAVAYWRQEHCWTRATLAGLSLTLASGLRYEGWMLIPALALLFWRRKSHLLIFAALASIVPLVWMISCYLATGDPLFGPHAAARWETVFELRNLGLNLGKLLSRFLFFNAVNFVGLTPLAALLSMVGIGWALRHSRRQAVWFWVTFFLSLVLLWKTMDGSLAWRARYAIPLCLMVLPYWVVGAETLFKRFATLTALVVAVSMPLIPTWAPGFLQPWEQECIRQWNSTLPAFPPEVRHLAAEVRRQVAQAPPAYIGDFIDDDWSESYYLALSTGLHPRDLFLMPGAKNQPLNTKELADFLIAHPLGIMVFDPASRFAQTVRLDQNIMQIDGLPGGLMLTERAVVAGKRVLIYDNQAMPGTPIAKNNQ